MRLDPKRRCSRMIFSKDGYKKCVRRKGHNGPHIDKDDCFTPLRIDWEDRSLMIRPRIQT